MKRYEFDEHGDTIAISGGEWVRYADHIDAMKRIAGEGAQQAPAVCDGKEQEAFEAWAKAERMDMSQHPLHYLFLNSRTDAARQGWKGAIEYCAKACAAPAPSASPADSFQARVQPWMLECFGAEIAADQQERNHRFLEESLELVQACGATASEAHQLVDYVYGRPVGEKHQEAGGVMVTLAALCLAQGLDMHAAGETELARIWTKVEQIRAKQAAKPKHSPLPQHVPAASPADEVEDAVIFAWATFDGEGSYDLRLFENNASYRRDYINRNGAKYADWVIPLYRLAASPADRGEDARDAARYRSAIALEDNAETLYAAVLNHGGGNYAAINAEFDASLSATPPAAEGK